MMMMMMMSVSGYHHLPCCEQRVQSATSYRFGAV